MSKYKYLNPKNVAGSISRKHHFSNPNTIEIVLTLLAISIISKLMDLLSREGKY